MNFFIGLFFFRLSGCGGGTSGSGLNGYEGTIYSTQGRALARVQVTIESTGDSTSTNEAGEFSLQSDANGLEVPFLLEAPTFRSRFTLKDVSTDSVKVSLNVQVDTETDQVQVDHFSLNAGMVGGCDRYFENTNPIRQANQVPAGTLCTIKVDVQGDNRPAGHIPFAIQYSRCESNSTWETIETGATGVGKFRGIGQLSFEFKSSPQFCRYRVVAPFQLSGYRPLFFPLDTFAEQEFFKTKK